MSPKRRPDWLPKLSHYKRTGQGRVRIPGKGEVYLGTSGCWPKGRRNPPPEVVEAYNREIAQFASARAEGREGIPVGPGCTINQLCLSYYRHALRWYTKGGKPTSQVELIGRALRELRALYGSTPAAAFRSVDLRAVRDRLERGGTMNRDTVNAHVQRIRRAFRWAAGEGLVDEDVWLRLRAVSGLQKGRSAAREPGTVRPVAADVVEATLPHLPPAVAAMARVQMLTGMRPEEVCGMRAGDVAEVDGLLRYVVREQFNKLAHKGIPRVVWLGPQAREAIWPWLEAARRAGPDAWVFPKSRGRGPIVTNRYRRIVANACRANGLPHWHPNQLRHTRATDTRMRHGIEGVQAELGHQRLETSQVYAEKSEELAKRIARESG